MSTTTKRIKEIATTFLVPAFLVLMSRGALAEPRYIPSSSMEPTLQLNDRLLIEKISPKLGIPQRGEIVVFENPQSDLGKDSPWQSFLRWQGYSDPAPLIKRVVGLPGEKVAVKAGKVWINDRILNESGYSHSTPAYTMAAIKIPAGHIFVMGDNRNNSWDSHLWGTLPLDKLRGTAVLRFWPLNRSGHPN
jgi:signal peptidase I